MTPLKLKYGGSSGPRKHCPLCGHGTWSHRCLERKIEQLLAANDTAQDRIDELEAKEAAVVTALLQRVRELEENQAYDVRENQRLGLVDLRKGKE